MKKANKIFATVLTLALVFTLPQTTIMSRAEGIGLTGMDGGYAGGEIGSIPEPTSPSSSSYESSSSASSSYDSGSSSASYSDSGASSYSDSGSGASDNGSATVAAPKKNANDITVGTTGGQKFRIVMSADHKSYQVFHCGISKATFVVADADGKTATYSTVALAKGEDGLWYLDISFPQGVDTTGYAVGVTKGDATYLSTTLGVNGLKVNGVLALSTVPATDAK